MGFEAMQSDFRAHVTLFCFFTFMPNDFLPSEQISYLIYIIENGKKELIRIRKEQSIVKMINYSECYLLKLFTTWPVLFLEAFYASETEHMFQNISSDYFCGKFSGARLGCPSLLSIST